MEENKIKNIKEREKFIEFKDFKAENGSTRKVRLNSINQYFIAENKVIITGKFEKIVLTCSTFEKAENILNKLDTFFNISKI